jgi:hypothetical protein
MLHSTLMSSGLVLPEMLGLLFILASNVCTLASLMHGCVCVRTLVVPNTSLPLDECIRSYGERVAELLKNHPAGWFCFDPQPNFCN